MAQHTEQWTGAGMDSTGNRIPGSMVSLMDFTLLLQAIASEDNPSPKKKRDRSKRPVPVEMVQFPGRRRYPSRFRNLKADRNQGFKQRSAAA